jgi:hypothetical protein
LSSTTTLAPKMAYSSSQRTHVYSSAGDRSRRGGRGVEGHKHRIHGREGWPVRWRAAAMAALPDGLGVAGGHAQAVAGEGFAQRWPGGA